MSKLKLKLAPSCLAGVFFLLAQSGCTLSGVPVWHTESYQERLLEDANLDEARAALESLVNMLESYEGREDEGTYPELVLVDEPEVRHFVDYHLNEQRRFLVESLERKRRYMPTLQRIFLEEGIPLSLINLALIESGYNPNARSRRGAVGMWQFIKSTGRMYGLRINWFVDERKDVPKSTRAAARFLRDLYDIYGDWYLAMAAYNGGAGRVNKAIKRAGTRDFFEIARTRHLRKETREFVPKILAVARIAKDPEGYGIRFDESY